MKIVLAISLAVVIQVPLFGQSKGGPDYWRQYASPTKNWCIDDRTGPNLVVSSAAKVGGTVSDEIGKPILEPKIYVGVRDPQTGHFVASAMVAPDGTFDLGIVNAGKFRLRVTDGHGALNRLVEIGAPRDLSCSDGVTCHLDVSVWFKCISRTPTCPNNSNGTGNHATQK